MTNPMQLVIGSTGSLGSAIVNELTLAGKPVRAHPDRVKGGEDSEGRIFEKRLLLSKRL